MESLGTTRIRSVSGQGLEPRTAAALFGWLWLVAGADLL